MDSSYLNSAAGAFLGILFVVMTLSIVSDGIYHAPVPETQGFMIEVADGTTETAQPAEEAGPAEIAPLLASADPVSGESQFKKCAACHTNDAANANKVGPGLWNIVNRPVATHEGFNYSAAMTEFSQGGTVVWDYQHLSDFIEAPKNHIPGTAMGFAGIKKVEDRADLLAYLRTLGDTPAPLPEATDASAEEAAPAEAAAPAVAAEPAAEPAATPAPTE
ncbi:cytochrome c family protein [Hoeflea sp.]|uniref:c-type cytochrome n=1 Tax=Hoeflea sp. TaxID=1940281 RepID=UPI0019AF36CF|nr:cytochrome c family protein [Hoeflea sp.]MBC7281717.1 cytochrome c family protein [Hoeflea sp.]